MDILEIPFHRHLNIERSEDEEDVIYSMEERPEVLNHLGTIHACAQLALAEATSGGFLIQQFPELNGKVIPVKVEVFNTENKKTLSAVFSLFITSI